MITFLSAWRALDDSRGRAELYRMWHAGASAGFTVPRSLEIMGERPDPGVEATRRWFLDGTRRGATLGDLARAGPATTSPVERGLLALGDEGGRLEQVIGLLAGYHERRHRAMLTVRKRMAYPVFTGIVATFIAPFPLLYFGHAAAYLATVGIGLGLWMLAGGGMVQTAARRFERDPALVRARFARALAIGVEAGLSLGPALRLAASSADERLVEFCARAAVVHPGAPLSEALLGAPCLTPDFLAALATAERTGDYASTMTRLAELYEDGFR